MMSLHPTKQRGSIGTVPKGLKSAGKRSGSVIKIEDDAEKDKLKKDIEMYKRENMMLRKGLNMPDIIEELKKSVAENNMEQMFFESLHELQFRLQQLEIDPSASESIRVKDLQKELDRERHLMESLRKEVHIKNTKIDDLERSIEENKITIETLTNKLTATSQTNNKLQREKSELESDKRHLTEEITILKAANTALKVQVSAMEKEMKDVNDRKMMSLAEEMSEIETLRRELRERDETIDNQKEQIRQLESDVVSIKRLFQETEASVKILEKTTDKQNDRLGELNKDKEQLHVENEILTKDLESLRSKCEKPNPLVDELKEELGKINEINNTFINELTDLRLKCDKQTTREDELKEELEKINESNQTFINELSDLRETNTNNERTIKELKERCSKIGETSNNGDDSLKRELAKLKVENEGLKTKKADLEITCHDAFEKITQQDKKLKQQEADHKKLVERKEETIQKLRLEKTMVDPTRSNATVAEVNALKDKLEKLSKELIETNAEIALLRKFDSKS